MTDEEFLKLALEFGAYRADELGKFIPIKGEHCFTQTELLAYSREIERRTLEKAEKKFEWLEGNLFHKQWNGVLSSGSRVYWSIHSGHRHITKEMTGDTLSEAVDYALRAMIKEKE